MAFIECFQSTCSHIHTTFAAYIMEGTESPERSIVAGLNRAAGRRDLNLKRHFLGLTHSAHWPAFTATFIRATHTLTHKQSIKGFRRPQVMGRHKHCVTHPTINCTGTLETSSIIDMVITLYHTTHPQNLWTTVHFICCSMTGTRDKAHWNFFAIKGHSQAFLKLQFTFILGF